MAGVELGNHQLQARLKCSEETSSLLTSIENTARCLHEREVAELLLVTCKQDVIDEERR